jgi:hypothetical protein
MSTKEGKEEGVPVEESKHPHKTNKNKKHELIERDINKTNKGP